MALIKIVTVSIVSVLFLSSCAQAADDTESLMKAAATLQKVAIDVDAFVSTTPTASSLSETEILRRATVRNPSRLDELSAYSLSVKVEGRNSAVLLCPMDKTRAYLEDAGCSAPTDKLHFQDAPNQTCTFTLNLTEVCR